MPPWSSDDGVVRSSDRAFRVRESGRLGVCMRLESCLKDAQRRSRLIGIFEEVQIVGIDHAMAHERVEVEYLAPICGTVENHRNAPRQLASLRQGQDLGELIERAEPSGERDESPGEMCEPQLTHEEVMKFETQLARDVGVRP